MYKAIHELLIVIDRVVSDEFLHGSVCRKLVSHQDRLLGIHMILKHGSQIFVR